MVRNFWEGLFVRARPGHGLDTRRAAERLMPVRNDTPCELDPWVLIATIGLLLYGLVMVYSASIATAEASRATGHVPHYYLARHAIFMLCGVAFALAAFRVPMATWRENSGRLFLLGMFLLVLVLVPGIGRAVNGSQRWIPLFVVNIQPSELMKIFTALYAADFTTRKMAEMSSLRRGFFPMLGAVMLVCALLLLEPDFGAMVVIVCIAFGVLFLGGINMRIIALMMVLVGALFFMLIWLSPYRRERLFGFMNPWEDPYGRGYQLSHALIAFGRGEWFGVGLGGSIEKQFYLPEAHTDFILSVIAEELGFAGVLVVIALFAILVYRAFAIGRMAAKKENHYAALVAMGIGLWFGMQSFFNMGVNMGRLPTKGLTLPLMCYGGSAIVANCIALAILLRIDWELREVQRNGRPPT
ncbi:MAG: putative lipid II flippase FtsW [Rhodocyclaceae bacterium]|nr:putative lipid II flippase FtsW [Rhodocyclaceae bacterium]